MRERSLVAFTVLGQAAVGMIWGLTAVVWAGGLGAGGLGPRQPWPGGLGSGGWPVGPLMTVGALLAAAAAAAVLHLGSPRNAGRALRNVRTSWLSREILLVAVFATGWVALVAASVAGVGDVAVAGTAGGFGGAAVRSALLGVVSIIGAALVYAMSRVYRLRTVPAWDTRLTTATFFLATAALGGLAAALAASFPGGPPGLGPVRLPAWIGIGAIALELSLEPAWGGHRRRARERVDPGLWADRRPARWTTRGRTILLATSLVFGLAGVLMLNVGHGSIGQAAVPPLLAVATAAAVAGEVAGRAAFYATHARVGM